MSTFDVVPFRNFLEPGVRDSHRKNLSEREEEEEESNKISGVARHLYVSPTLYTTPEQAPIAECSSEDLLSPSPYVANQKRRRGGEETNRVDTGGVQEFPSGDFSVEGFVNEKLVVNDDDDEVFLDPRSESMSVGSEVEADDYVAGGKMENRSLVSAQGEFFDAEDGFSSDGSMSNTRSRTESDLQATRMSILEEIGKRKIAEETLTLMRSQWLRIGNLMSEAGFTFPAPPDGGENLNLEDNTVEQLSQEIVVTRFVAEAIGRGLGRAEAEEAAAVIIESKDQEISRLRDKVQYYEAVNHQLSQRKLVEAVRRQQERKRNRRRWIWSFMGLSVVIGASYVAYLYLPHTSNHLSSLKSCDAADADYISNSDAS